MEVIANEIETARSLYSEVVGHFSKGFEKSIELGRLLNRVKARLEHGQFGQWCSEAFGDSMSRATRSRLMNAAEACDADASLLKLGSIERVNRSLRKPFSSDRQMLQLATFDQKAEQIRQSEPVKSVKRLTQKHIARVVEPEQNRAEEEKTQVEKAPIAADPLSILSASESLSSICIARVISGLLDLLQSRVSEPGVQACLIDLRDTANLLLGEQTLDTSRDSAEKLDAESAIQSVDAIAERLKPGCKTRFRDQMMRRWSVKTEELKSSSKPENYLPRLPRDENALRCLFFEFRYRLKELRDIDPETFRRVAERQQFEKTIAFCHETVDKVRSRVMPSSRKRNLFENEKYPEVLQTKEFMEAWETRLDQMKKKGSVVPSTWEPNALEKLAAVGHAKALKAVLTCNGNNGFQLMYVDYEEKKSNAYKGKDPSLGVPESTMRQVLCDWKDVVEHLKESSSFRARRRAIRAYRDLPVDTPDFVGSGV